MKKLNLYLTLSSLTVLLVTIERFSPTTKILLQPYNFLRLHELVQMGLIILFTILIPFFILYEITGKLETLKTHKGKILALAFIVGTYFNATGNGVHEIASFLFNNYCPQENFTSSICNVTFFNDYYFGNIVYFVGGFLMTVALVKLEIMWPKGGFVKKDWIILVINSLVYSLAVIAYAAFDRVLVGLYYVLITTVVVDFLFLFSKNKYKTMPFSIYTVLTYTIGSVVSLILRFH